MQIWKEYENLTERLNEGQESGEEQRPSRGISRIRRPLRCGVYIYSKLCSNKFIHNRQFNQRSLDMPRHHRWKANINQSITDSPNTTFMSSSITNLDKLYPQFLLPVPIIQGLVTMCKDEAFSTTTAGFRRKHGQIFGSSAQTSNFCAKNLQKRNKRKPEKQKQKKGCFSSKFFPHLFCFRIKNPLSSITYATPSADLRQHFIRYTPYYCGQIFMQINTK